jgi:hypothetical protein
MAKMNHTPRRNRRSPAEWPARRRNASTIGEPLRESSE